ncbi:MULTISPECIES: peptide ABC transporter substrate-binding protein [unclassified Serinicoccus]|uniref:peptide ABC transporter substrate-binding protein n=1 Tax=unclassified Serinicoccus TaxID=2643101 RepID=UPI00385316E8
MPHLNRTGALGALIAVGLVTSSCSFDGAEDGTAATDGATGSGGTLSFQGGEPTSLVPHKDIGSQIAMATCANLVEINKETQEFEPLAAESVESEDSQTWTITLRDGWTFQDGSPVTSASFVDAWNHAAYGPNAWQANGYFTSFVGYPDLNPTDGGEPAATELSGLTATDERTITVELSEPNADFPKTLSTNALCPLPPQAFEDPDAYEEDPVSNGPYQVTSWDRNQQVVLERWTDFQGDAAFSGEADTLVAKVYTSVDSAYTDLAAGNLDMIRNVPAAMVSRAESELDEGALYQVSEQSKQFTFQVPTYVPELEDPRVRRAIAMSIDRESIASSLMQGNAEPSDSLVPPSIDSYVEGACDACTFDPEQARTLLEEAGGLPDGLTVTYNADREQQLVQALGRQIGENLGVEVRLNPVMGTQLSELTNTQQHEGIVFGLWGWTYKSPDQYLSQYETGGDGNLATGYSNPEVDELIAEARGEQDEAVRQDLYAQAEADILEDMPAIPLFIPLDHGLQSEAAELNDVQGDIQFYRADARG